MICCLVGGALVAIMARAARKSRRHGGELHASLAALFGFTAGMFVLEMLVTLLAPLGLVLTTGTLAPRLLLLVAPGLGALAAVAAGALDGLADRRGVTLLTFTVAGGALLAEELDLHLLDLHSPRHAVGWVVVHLAVVVLLVAGLVARRYAGRDAACCRQNDGAPGVPQPTATALNTGAGYERSS